MSVPAVRTRGLSKHFRSRTGFFSKPTNKLAVDAVDLEIAEGELFVLLGRNGAGKTTLVKILSTLVLPNGGTAEIFGHDVEHDDAAVRRLIGLATPEERSFFWRLSGRQNLQFFAALHGLHGRAQRERLDEVIGWLDIAEYVDRRFDGYSSGMKQRISLARGLLGRPRLLFLDEPTRSLDPSAQKQTRELIHRLRAERTLTVILVTHQLDEARELGDRLGYMKDGRLEVFERGAVDLATLF